MSSFPGLWFGDCMLGWHAYDPCYFVSQSLIGWLCFDAFNPIDVNFDISIAHQCELWLWHSTLLQQPLQAMRHKMAASGLEMNVLLLYIVLSLWLFTGCHELRTSIIFMHGWWSYRFKIYTSINIYKYKKLQVLLVNLQMIIQGFEFTSSFMMHMDIAGDHMINVY